MSTPYSLFLLLSEEQQYAAVWQDGTFLARRYEEEDAVHLYHMDGGFLVEVYYDHRLNQLQRAEAFELSDRERLDKYEAYIQLEI